MSNAPSILDRAPVVPVVVLYDTADAVPVARALVAGGLPIIELTLRTPSALECIRRIAAEVPEIEVGAGTVLSPRDAEAAAAAGARFLVSPGSTPTLIDAMSSTQLAFLPGVATVSEAMVLREAGIKELKFFPAEAAGGVAMLRSIAGPLPDLLFCPTGGITPGSAPTYLALPNVAWIGGSWLTPQAAIDAQDWAQITRLAREATALR